MKENELNNRFSKKILAILALSIVAMLCVLLFGFEPNKVTHAEGADDENSITLVENGGVYIEEYIKPISYANGTETALPTREQITKQGYILAGWTATNEPFNETTNPYITTISALETGDKTFYAKWAKKTYIYDISISPSSSPINIRYELYGRTEDPTIKYLMYENISDPSTASNNIDIDRKYNESDYYDCEIHFPEGEDYAHFFMGSFSITKGVYKIYGNTCFSNDSGDGNFYVNGGTLIIAGGEHITGSNCDVTAFATFVSGRIEIQNGTISGDIVTFTPDLEDELAEIIISNGAKLTDEFYISLDQGVKIIDNGYTANELEENKPKIKIWLVPDDYRDTKWTVGDLIVQEGTSIPQLNDYYLESYYFDEDSDDFVLGIGENNTIILSKEYTVTWKNGDFVLETDIKQKIGETPLYNGAVPTKTTDATNYIYQFLGWKNGENEYINTNLPTIESNTVYTAIFAKKYINFKTEPTINDSIDSTINIANGVDDELVFVVKVKEATEINQNIVAPKGKEIVKSYNAKLLKGEIEYSSYTGTMTIKIATPTELVGRKNVQIVIIDKETGTAVTKMATIENDYLIFETNSLGDFSIVADKETNLLWLWILLGLIGLSLFVLLLLFIFVYEHKVTFILNNKKVGVAKYKKGEELKFPLNLARYKWFTDKKQTKLLTKQKMGWFGFTVYRTTKKSD